MTLEAVLYLGEATHLPIPTRQLLGNMVLHCQLLDARHNWDACAYYGAMCFTSLSIGLSLSRIPPFHLAVPLFELLPIPFLSHSSVKLLLALELTQAEW